MVMPRCPPQNNYDRHVGLPEAEVGKSRIYRDRIQARF
jgi:hypothetical protein